MHHCAACEEAREMHDRPYCEDCKKHTFNAFCSVTPRSKTNKLFWPLFMVTLVVALGLNWFYPSPFLLVLYVVPILLFALLVPSMLGVLLLSGGLVALSIQLMPNAMLGIAALITYIAVILLIKRLVQVSRNNHKQKVEYEELFLNTVLSFAKSIDARDPYTSFHSKNVANYGRKIALEMGLSHGEAEAVYLAGLIHDIGKIGTPEHILHKESRLTDEEYEIMKKHAEDGYQIIKDIRRLDEMGVTKMVRHHHERMDGRGYPLGLQGTDIPLGARILGASDAFDAMTTNRSYRAKLSLDTAFEELRRHSGTQFDPQVVQAFLTVLQRDGVLETQKRGAFQAIPLQRTS